jgi:hypothetical protein
MLWAIAAIAAFFITTVIDASAFVTVGKITRIGTGFGQEGLFVTLDMPMHDNGCNSKDTLFMARENKQYQETLSIVLLALAQARPIDVLYDGTTCHGDDAVLSAVAVRTNP